MDQAQLCYSLTGDPGWSLHLLELLLANLQNEDNSYCTAVSPALQACCEGQMRHRW